MLAQPPSRRLHHHFGQVMIILCNWLPLSLVAPADPRIKIPIYLRSLLIRLIGKQQFLVGPHGIDHLGLVVVTSRDLDARMVKHSHRQSYVRTMMDGSAGC
jgi:hypothetical protein